MYLAVPMILYACERLIRAFRSGYKTVRILKVHFREFSSLCFDFDFSDCVRNNLFFKQTQVAVYPGNVLALQMSKPQGFKYTSGQYIYVKCSDVSPFQWYIIYHI